MGQAHPGQARINTPTLGSDAHTPRTMPHEGEEEGTAGGGARALAEQGLAPDCLQRPLVPRSRFRQQVKLALI
jgi:hypothetical protein